MHTLILKAIRLKAVYLFLLVYFTAAFVKNTFTGKGFGDPVFSFLLFFCVFGSLTFLITARAKCHIITIRQPPREALIVVLYFVLWLVVYMLLRPNIFQNTYLSNGLGFWGMLVLVPFVYFFNKGYRLSDFGLTLKGFGPNMKVAVLAGLIIGPVLLLLTPGGKYILSGNLSTSGLIQALFAGFGLAFLLAGFFEEFFFRAIIQTRLTAYYRSHFTGIVSASILFGLYHLPFYFFGNGPAAGNLSFSLASIFTETLVAAPVLGILWARTQNLIAPVFVHSLIDTISGLPRVAAFFDLH